jgi:alkylation response protein AidB-like acyl-CoA dehydrogenase
VASGEVPVAEASILKVLSNEARLELLGETLQALGDVSLIRKGSPGALADSRRAPFGNQRMDAVINLFGGGNNDIQRDIIATHGLGLPR